MHKSRFAGRGNQIGRPEAGEQVVKGPSSDVKLLDAVVAQGKLDALKGILKGFGSGAVVAYSGGADSAFLAYCAHAALGDKALAVTADSASLARSELVDASEFAARFGIHHQIVATDELNDDRYTRNAGDRCYFCKDAVMRALLAIRDSLGGAEILVGVNVDDLGDYRPGQAAVRRLGGRCPLVEAGLTKSEIRLLSRELGLPTWNRPAAACLSSRIAYGVPVTVDALRRIEKSEAALKALGLGGQLRVRDHGAGVARIEVDLESLDTLLPHREAIVEGLKGAGFVFVTLDLEGYRIGSHNAGLRKDHRAGGVRPAPPGDR